MDIICVLDVSGSMSQEAPMGRSSEAEPGEDPKLGRQRRLDSAGRSQARGEDGATGSSRASYNILLITNPIWCIPLWLRLWTQIIAR